MSRTTAAVAVAVALALVAGCTGDDRGDATSSSDGRGELVPTFPPAETADGDDAAGTGTDATGATVDGTGDGDDNGGLTDPPPGDTPATGADPGGPGTVPEASFTDPVGDPTLSPVDRRPDWADLAGGVLRRHDDGWELRIRLAAEAPQSTDDDHTMNLASFYDVDGDGRIDYEVWVNVASTGWGPVYYDHVGDGGGYLEGSDVSVEVTGQEVVLRFPLEHLAGATTLRWSLASEWGRYEALGTPAMARDDAPDDDRPAPFPG